MNRRSFLTGMGSLFAAPAIVHAGNLMPIKVIPFDPYMLLRGPSLYTGEMHEVRLYEDASRLDSFVSVDFLKRYESASSQFAGLPEQVGIAHTREDEKAMRMIPTGDVADYRCFALGHSEFSPFAEDTRTAWIDPTQYATLQHKGFRA